ncbi:hypothetical protein L204_102659 [Cryptococcus depauperatus]|nr:hypothetical protein L204_00591 [Cryptococcus depauperatus CBS 7855]
MRTYSVLVAVFAATLASSSPLDTYRKPSFLTAIGPGNIQHNGQSQASLDGFGIFRNYDYPLPRSTAEQGWLSRWLFMGGEGRVVVHANYKEYQNVTLPHRPAAFPNHILHPLPLTGFVIPFSSLSPASPLGCSPSPISRPPSTPKQPYKIVLVERGGCDFATKVRAAQQIGAAAVVVGDNAARVGETEDEGRRREGLITMFSPEDTDDVFIPSVFVSRASFLLLRDLLANHTDSRYGEDKGLWVDVSESTDEGSALNSLLSFALLMPTIFLLITMAIHRLRVAHQREADRAPAMVVLSLPERIWSPDIVWEKDESEEDTPSRVKESRRPEDYGNEFEEQSIEEAYSSVACPPPSIHPSSLSTPPSQTHSLPCANFDSFPSLPNSPILAGPSMRKNPKRQFFSKDECAICMDAFEKGDVVRILPCGHVFHKEECDEWLMKWRKLCPTCRADVTLPPGHTRGSSMTPLYASGAPPSSSGVVDTIEEAINPQRSWSSTIKIAWRNAKARLGIILGTRNARLNQDESQLLLEGSEGV